MKTYKNQKGTILFIAAIILPVLLIIAAIVVDIASYAYIKEELRNTAVASSHYGALLLKKDKTNFAEELKQFALQNNNTIDSEDIEINLGNYSYGTNSFISLKKPTNAVQVKISYGAKSIFGRNIISSNSIVVQSVAFVDSNNKITLKY